MSAQDKPAGGSPFEIITPGKSKKIGRTGIIVGISIVIFLILSVVAGVLLVRQQQNVAEKAATTGNQCPAAEACPVTGNPNLLRSCHPQESDGSPDESLCNQAGRIQTCGAASAQYCCPAVGGSWTTNMTACTVASPSPSPSPSPSASPSESPTPTAAAGANNGNSCNGTCGSNSNCQNGLYCYSGFCRNPLCASDSSCGCSSATNTPSPTATGASTTTTTTTTTTQTTPLPIPVTGTDWPTVTGIGIGIGAIIVSLLIAL